MNSKYFIPVLSSHKIALNKPVKVLLDNIPVVLIKSASGISAFEDFCPHRGLALSEGFISNGQLQCKYHGWSFDLKNGENTSIPAKNSKIKCGLKTIFVKECFDLIWLSYNQDALIATLNPETPSLFLTGKINANITHVLENFLEGSHTHYVHDGLVRTKNKERNAIKAELSNAIDGFTVKYEIEPAKGLLTKLLPKKYSSLKPVSKYIHPGIAVLTYINQANKEIARFEAILVTEGEDVKYYARIFIIVGWLNPFIKPFASIIFKKVIEQDKVILELQQRNLCRFKENKFVSDETDMVGKYIYAWQNSKNQDLPEITSFQVFW